MLLKQQGRCNHIRSIDSGKEIRADKAVKLFEMNENIFTNSKSKYLENNPKQVNVNLRKKVSGL